MDDTALCGEIRIFAGFFPPYDWAFCNGQLLSIRMYPALFSLIGITYGGDADATFGVPNLNGRVPIGQGTGEGLTARLTGEIDGIPAYTLNPLTLPVHNHLIACNTRVGDQNSPANNFFGTGPINRSTGKPVNTRYSSTLSQSQMMAGDVLSPYGSATPAAINNIQPTLGLNFVICLVGHYPIFD